MLPRGCCFRMRGQCFGDGEMWLSPGWCCRARRRTRRRRPRPGGAPSPLQSLSGVRRTMPVPPKRRSRLLWRPTVPKASRLLKSHSCSLWPKPPGKMRRLRRRIRQKTRRELFLRLQCFSSVGGFVNILHARNGFGGLHTFQELVRRKISISWRVRGDCRCLFRAVMRAFSLDARARWFRQTNRSLTSVALGARSPEVYRTAEDPLNRKQRDHLGEPIDEAERVRETWQKRRLASFPLSKIHKTHQNN